MATSIRPSGRQLYRFAVVAAFALGFGGTLLLAGTPGAHAQASVGMDTLNVTGAERTVDGNVTDVRVSATLDYQHDVPDATQRVVRLQVSRVNGTPETVAYRVNPEPSGTASGTVTLEGSVLDNGALSAADFTPALASNTTTDLLVRAEVEVTRPNGETVTHAVTDTATVALRDDGSLTATLGGSGSVTVETDA